MASHPIVAAAMILLEVVKQVFALKMSCEMSSVNIGAFYSSRAQVEAKAEAISMKY